MKTKGFTLIEAIATMVILAFAMSGALYLLSSIIFATEKNEKRLMGTYLAQECTELVRNARDTAWKKRLPWDKAFESPTPLSAKFIIEADHNNMAPPISGESFGLLIKEISSDSEAKLYLDGSAYTHTPSTTPTEYSRFFTIKSKGANAIAIECAVEWKYRGQDEKVAISTILTNWYKN